MDRAGSIAIILLLLTGALMSGSTAFRTALFAAAVLILLYLIMDLVFRRSLTVDVKALAGAGQAGKGGVRIAARNTCPIPLIATIDVKVTNRYTEESSRRRIRLSVPGKGTSETIFEISSGRSGKITVTADRARLMDPLGLIGVKSGSSSSGSFTVLPDIFDVRTEYLLRESGSFDNDTYSPYKKGRDRSEVFQVREYEEGDSLSQIHWKLSSKTDKLVVKDPSLPLDKSIVVMIDKTVASPISPDEKERLAELFVSVCEGLLESGLTYRLIRQEGDTVSVREIEYEEDLAEEVPKVLSEPPAPGKSPLEIYRSLYGEGDATHLIYIRSGMEGMPGKDEAAGAFPGALLVPVYTSPDQRERCQTLLMEEDL